MYNSQKPSFRIAFENEILGNLTRRHGDISYANEDALVQECLFYAIDMCITFHEKSGGFLPEDWKMHIFNEVCAVFEKHFPNKFNKSKCNLLFTNFMKYMNEAREEMRRYYNRQ